MSKRVLLVTKDLMFRGKLCAVVVAAGGEVTPDAAEADVVVIELEASDWEERVRLGVAGGKTVIAFGSHVDVERLRAARALGAEAVPNSQVETAVAGVLHRV